MKKSAQNYQGGAHERSIKPNHTTSALHGGSLGSLNKLELWTNVMKKSVQSIMYYYGGAHESCLKEHGSFIYEMCRNMQQNDIMLLRMKAP